MDNLASGTNRGVNRIAVKIRYRSGWPAGTGDGEPNFGMAIEKSSPWTFSQHASEQSARVGNAGSWFGFGGGSPDVAQEAAVRWLKARRLEPGWRVEPPFPPDNVGFFYRRSVEGTFLFDPSALPGASAVGSLHLGLAAFDIDGSMIERDFIKNC